MFFERREMDQAKLDYFKAELLRKKEEIIREEGKTLEEMGQTSNIPDPTAPLASVKGAANVSA